MFDRYVGFAARQVPHLIAVSNGRDHVSYREFDKAIDSVATALSSAIGDRGEAVVGLSVRDGYRHVLLALACARLGAASASLFPQMTVPLARQVGVDLLVVDEASAAAGWDGASLCADAAWFAHAGAQPVSRLPTLRLAPDGLARVQLSSGSTGLPKAVELDWATLGARVAAGMFGGGDGMRRILSLIGPESGAFQLLLTTWKQRGCVLFAPQNAADIAALLPVLQPSGMLASPVQLAALLDALPADFTPFGQVQIAVAGGKLSAALADRVAVRLGARITSVYASTEAGTTATGHCAAMPTDGAVGFVTPGTHIEIVDEKGVPLAAGEIGRVRISGSEVATRYRGEPAGATLGDGVFHPGDLGSLDDDGLLRIVGREDEVLNLGGEKFLPDALEAQVRGVPGVADVAAFALDDADGNAKPWLAIVRDGEVDDGAIGRALTIPGLPPVRVAWIEAIPRTLMGKIRRDELRIAARALAK